MKKLLIFGVLLLTLFGCSSNNSAVNAKPTWVDNPKVKYPESLYLAAVGYGSSRRAAESDAMGSIARIFKTDVRTNNKYTERLKEISSNTEDEVSLYSENTKEISMNAEQSLVNIEIGETYTDNLGRVFSLAYINRSRTADIYDEKIVHTNQKIDYYLAQTEATDDMYKKYSFMSSASAYAYKNKELLNQLAIISPNDYEIVGVEDKFESIQTDLREIAKMISFKVAFKNEENFFFTNSISEVINELNFNITEEKAMLDITGEVSYTELDLERKEKFVKYDFILQIKDTNDNTVASINKKGRVGGINPTEAKSKTMRYIRLEIEKNLEKTIINYFDSLTK